MNSALDPEEIQAEFDRDPVAAASEFGAEFRSDISDYVPIEPLTAAIDEGVYQRKPEKGNRYVAFIDPAGGSGKDSFALAIAHAERKVAAQYEGDPKANDGGTVIVDLGKVWTPPFDPVDICGQVARELKPYGIRLVTADHWSAAWVESALRDNKVRFKTTKDTKAVIYANALPMILSATVRLPDIPLLKKQFLGLQRIGQRSGKETIDHAPGQHDDLVNAVCGAMILAKKPVFKIGMIPCSPGIGGGVVKVGNW